MPFFDAKSGALSLANGVSLTAHMQAADLFAALDALGGGATGHRDGCAVPFPTLCVLGGRIALLAFLEKSTLSAVSLSVTGIGQKASPSAEQQRALLFSLFRCKDPCPDTQRSCRVDCDFGSVIISTDPRTGYAHARISYSLNA